MNLDILDRINSPQDLKKLKESELPLLCDEIREYIIDTLSNVGGHFASNLGVVELTVALHYIYDTPIDKLIWDVGHQTYPHKMLTGRKNQLPTIRKFGGISGFPKREESEYDLYNNGHAGTSISQLIGEAVARDKIGAKYKCIAVIGDASIATGMSLEALNHGGHIKPNCLVVLNDNYMSISKNVGSISNYLNNIISSRTYSRWKKEYNEILNGFPFIGQNLLNASKRIEKSFKEFLIPGALFEDLGFRYFGPVDGHKMDQLISILQNLKNIEGPIILHVITQKGKGYIPAEIDPTRFHGVSPFNKINGEMPVSEKSISYSNIIGECLIKLTEKNNKIVAITPAMIEGSGLKDYSIQFPNNLFDVGIAEQHSVTFASGLLGGGLLPFMCIYSTFMLRAIGQIMHDVSLMNLPVRFVIDRAGCVGPDGETHQGLFDLCYLAALPNMDIICPVTGQDLIDCMMYMSNFDQSPIAIRFPKDSCDKSKLDFTNYQELERGKSRVIQKGNHITLLSIGSMYKTALEVAHLLEEQNLSITVLDLFWIRPLDKETIESMIEQTERFAILDESYLDGGASGYILNRIRPELLNRFIKTFAFPSEPIVHGEKKEIFEKYGLDASSISEQILAVIKNQTTQGKNTNYLSCYY